MCGIAGYIGRATIAEPRVEACLAAMGRRGPDGQGTYRHTFGEQHVVLLHTRLSIIDLDPRASQPMLADGHALSYNGELYNYLEVRSRLGGTWRTDSDTEVLLRQLAEHGLDGLDACEGMWAFAWYRESDGCLTLSRDRFGEKPLVIVETDDGLYFGSEPKFIHALLGRTLPVNRDHLMRYLVNGYRSLYTTDTSTFYEGMGQLGHGEYMVVLPDGGRRVERYWRYDLQQNDDMSFAEAVAGTRERLIRSVELRLRADVPIAFCLSGGIDSCGLIGIAKRVFGYDVHGFTVISDDDRYDETAEVDIMVRELGLRHTKVKTSTTNFLANMRRIVEYHDAPIATISYYVHWTLMQAVHAAGYKISVSGSGGDEIYSGYYDHHLMYLAEVASDPDLFRESLENWQTHIKPIIRNPHFQDPLRFVHDPGFRAHIAMGSREKSALFPGSWSEELTEQAYQTSLLRMRMLNEMFHEVMPVILHEDDANAMYFSIENRSPYLDRHLFEFAQTIPSRHLIRDGKAKAVLREAIRGIVPDAIVDNRRKVGFNASISELFDLNSRENREWLCRPPAGQLAPKPELLEAILNGESIPNHLSMLLFSIIGTRVFQDSAAHSQ